MFILLNMYRYYVQPDLLSGVTFWPLLSHVSLSEKEYNIYCFNTLHKLYTSSVASLYAVVSR